MDKNFIREPVNELYFATEDLTAMFDYLEAPVGELQGIRNYKEG